MGTQPAPSIYNPFLGLQHSIYLKIMEGSRDLEFSRSCGLILLTDFSCSRHCILRSNIHKCSVLVLVLSGVGNNAILKSWLVSKRKDSQGCFEPSSVMLWGQSLKVRPFVVFRCLCSLLKDIRLLCLHSSFLCRELCSFYGAINIFCCYLYKRVELFKILAKSQFLPCPLYTNLSCRNCLLW